MFKIITKKEADKLTAKPIIDSDFIVKKDIFKVKIMSDKEIIECNINEYDDKNLRKWINSSKIPKDKGQRFFKWACKSKEQIDKDNMDRMYRTHQQFGF